MKRLMPSSLIAFLANNRNCQKADLFSIFLPTGQTLNVTEGQWDITVPLGTPGWQGPTTTFYSVQYGKWTRGAITSEASYNLNSNSMALTVVPKVGVSYPGLSIGMLNAAINGLFDASQLYCYTVYMPVDGYGNVSAGVETKFFGQIVAITSITRIACEFKCADPFFLLNMKIPTRLLQTNCPWSFGDSNCNPPGGKAAFTQTFAAASGSTQWILNPVSPTGNLTVAGYYLQGVVTCLTGNNAGLSNTVKLQLASSPYSLTMMNKWLLPVSAGDTFSVLAGCDKTQSTCLLKFNNLSNHAGMPYIPPASNAF